ncbi:MAG: hypothetical protein Q8P25_03170 [Candidatus Curtissbacteria bacterium]|nr:hypothetical protein [Candidatus Curtissbacteria bacterium]
MSQETDKILTDILSGRVEVLSLLTIAQRKTECFGGFVKRVLNGKATY